MQVTGAGVSQVRGAGGCAKWRNSKDTPPSHAGSPSRIVSPARASVTFNDHDRLWPSGHESVRGSPRLAVAEVTPPASCPLPSVDLRHAVLGKGVQKQTVLATGPRALRGLPVFPACRVGSFLRRRPLRGRRSGNSLPRGSSCFLRQKQPRWSFLPLSSPLKRERSMALNTNQSLNYLLCKSPRRNAN